MSYIVKVTHKDKEYHYVRENRLDNSAHKGDWTNEDEVIFAEGLGLPKLEEDGTVARERWNVPRLNKLLWYKNSLTLRNRFGKIDINKLTESLDKIIQQEKRKKHMLNCEFYTIDKNIRDQFNMMNGIAA